MRVPRAGQSIWWSAGAIITVGAIVGLSAMGLPHVTSPGVVAVVTGLTISFLIVALVVAVDTRGK